MKKNNNVKCVVCGKGYHLCMSCKDKIAMKPWKVLTDTSEHYKVHQVISGYRGGIYTKDEARVALENIDISDKNTYLDSVKKVLDEILKVEKPVMVKTEKKVVKTVMPKKIQSKVEKKVEETDNDDKENEEVK